MTIYKSIVIITLLFELDVDKALKHPIY